MAGQWRYPLAVPDQAKMKLSRVVWPVSERAARRELPLDAPKVRYEAVRL